MICWRQIAICLVTWSLSTSCYAQELRDWLVADKCRQAVLACQLADGSIVTVGYPDNGRPALIEPYFAHWACAGVLAAEQYKPNVANRKFVFKWLSWYARQQLADNAIHVYSGTRGAQGIENMVRVNPDSLDSYAGLYCYVAGRYANLTKTNLSPEVAACCVRMLNVLQSCRSPNGLFWNFPPGTPGVVPAEYLLDNLEVYQGLQEIVRPLKVAGYGVEASWAAQTAAALGTKLGDFWSPTHNYYVSMYGDLAAGVPFGGQPLHAEGLATVSALAFFDSPPLTRHQTLWTRFQQAYANSLLIGYGTNNYPLEDPTIERVTMAALRAGPAQDVTLHREMLLTRANSLLMRNQQLANPDNNPFPYCHRFGLMIVALLSPTGQPTPYLPTVP